MKKLFRCVIALMLMVLILAFLSPSVSAKTESEAMMEKKTTTSSAAMQEDETAVMANVQYDLPYPGMLPNSSLYFLKQARDWILDKLISDPIKKTEFYILQGDKRLAMGVMLSASGDGKLSEEIISKGEKYMHNATQSLLSLKSQGKNVPAYIIDHLEKALAKHAELISEQIEKTADEALKAGLTGSLDLVRTLQQEVLKLK